MQRCVYDGHILLVDDRLAVDHELIEHIGICFINFLAPVGKKSFCLCFLKRIRMDRSDILYAFDKGKDLRSSLRRYLSAVFAIYFISVVLGRVVARRDHDTRKGLVPADRVGEHRYRTKLIRKIYTDTHRGKCTGSDLCEFRREMTGIVGNNDTTLHCILSFTYDKASEAIGCL